MIGVFSTLRNIIYHLTLHPLVTDRTWKQNFSRNLGLCKRNKHQWCLLVTVLNDPQKIRARNLKESCPPSTGWWSPYFHMFGMGVAKGQDRTQSQIPYQESVADFTCLGSKITADGDSSHEIKTLAPWKKNHDQPRQHTKSRDITLLTKVCLVKVRFSQ